MRIWLFALALTLPGCHPPNRSEAIAPNPSLETESGPTSLGALAGGSTLTVLTFFAADCPVQKAHDARLREVVAAYEPRGVKFYGVVSEVGGDIAADRADARRRGLTLPLVEDRGAVLADALGAEYSTHAVVVDKERRILYSGAFDSDRTHLTPKAEPYLREALDAALSGNAVAKPRTEALGCPLRKH